MIGGRCRLENFSGGVNMFDLGLILGPSETTRCDDFRLGGAVVRYDERLHCWRMWYYCRDQSFPAEIAPAFGTGTIATAVSNDGLRWQREVGPLQGGAVFAPSDDASAFDCLHVATGDIVRWKDRWLMVYFGGSRQVPQGAFEMYTHPGYLLRLGLAESVDGVNWSRLPGDGPGGSIVDVDDSIVYAAFPGFVALDDRLLIHYTGVDKRGRFHFTRVVASDRDLTAWAPAPEFVFTRDPDLHESAGIITRDIVENPLHEGGRWLMVYTARDGRPETGERRSICAAFSDDLVTWTPRGRTPFFTVGPQGAWDSAGVATARLVVTPEDFRLYYYGWSNNSYVGHPGRGIGCAVSANQSLDDFRRVDLNS